VDTDETQPIVNIAASLEGRVISRYRLLSCIGRGGMGEVWKAEDLKLRRLVALKFLPRGIAATPGLLARFRIEAQAIAALDHPAICGIYDVDEQEGLAFLSMNYIEGQTLAEKLRAGPLRFDDALMITRLIAEGLQVAHAQNIIHCDIKTSNIMIPRDGGVKILDFGLARVSWAPDLARDGLAFGTPAYMSPEQALGGSVDHRTDLWSLGVVLYEMIVGCRPFSQEKKALIEALVHQPLGEIKGGREKVSPELERIIRKLLEKRPQDRYHSAAALLADLAQLSRASQEGAPWPATGTTGVEVTRVPSLAVLPFANLSSDPENEYFSDGLTEELINALAQLRGLRVLSRTSAFATKGRKGGIKALGKVLRVDSVLEGSVRKSANRLRINVNLVRVSDGSTVWSNGYDRELDDVFAIQQDIALRVCEALKAELLTEDTTLLANRHSRSVQAYELYLQGIYCLRQMSPSTLELARGYFEHALRADPNYAPAHAGIASYHYQLGFYNMVPPKHALQPALHHVSRALELDGDLAEAHRIIGEVLMDLEWDWSGAEEHFRKAIELSPGQASNHFSYALLLMKRGRFADAHWELDLALQLDPVAPYLNSALAYLFYYQRDYAQAEQAVQKTLELDPNHFEVRGCQALVYLEQGRFEPAIQAFEKARDLSQGHPLSLAFLAYGLAVAGRQEESRALLEQLLQLSETMYISPGYIGVIYIGLHDPDKACEWLDRAYEARDSLLTFLHILHSFDPLRQDERFAALLMKTGLANESAINSTPASTRPSAAAT
jgi:eukaryotic-like serine/threonine-protein kinase